MHLVDEIGFEILPDRRDAAANPDVAAARCLSRALQRLMDAAGHEVEGRAAVHLQRRARMVGEDEDWDMIGRRLAPPRSEEPTSELQSLMRTSFAVFRL